MKPRGIIHKRSGEKLVRECESAILITSTVANVEPGTPGEVQVDNEVISPEAYIHMVGELLTIMHEQFGENMVAQAIAHYAANVGMVQHRDGAPDFVHIRGRKD
jgi:hypothetical protein